MGAQPIPGTPGSPRSVRGPAAPVIQGAALPLVEVQGSAHIVSDANSAFCRLLGKTRRELVGKPFEEIVPDGASCLPLLNSIYQTEDAASLAPGEEPPPVRARWLYVKWPTLEAVKTPLGVILRLMEADSFQQDAAAANEALLIAGLRQHELKDVAEKLNIQLKEEICERKLAETALRAAIADLEHAHVTTERASRAKDDFLAALSHELRTPLTPVLMAAAALREDERLPNYAREQLGMMERNIALEARLIDDLLDLTKISQGKLQFNVEPCDAHHLIRRAIEIVEEDARAKGIVIERDFTAPNSWLSADPARFQQVIWNLLRNAVKFSATGGRISIRTHQVERIAEHDTRLRVEVTDTGIGIDSARLEQIFEPFHQGELSGDQRFGGVGLGLTIARAVVHLHGGRIHARSPGKNGGSTFVVELPGTAGPHSGIAESNPPASAGLPAKKVEMAPLRILLVEDHANTRETLAWLLQNDGHHVIAVGTAAAALAAANANELDFVISDLGLPDGSGVEVMQALHDVHGLRGIALSGYGADDDVRRSREAGFLMHLVKPVSIASVRRVIASLPAKGR